MLKLFIDSSRMELVLILLEDNEVVSKVILDTKGKHSEYIMAELESMFKKTQKELKELKEVICTKGPGSFTGVRIGVTIAKTIAYSLGIDLKSISTLKALSYSNYDIRVVCMDAKKDRVYAAIFGKNGVILHDSNIAIETLVEHISNLKGTVSVTGDATIKYKDKLSNYGDIIEEKINVEMLIQDIDAFDLEDAISFAPTYLKLTDAEIQYNEKIKNENK